MTRKLQRIVLAMAHGLVGGLALTLATQAADAQWQCQHCGVYQGWFWDSPPQSIATSFAVIDNAASTFWASQWQIPYGTGISGGYIGIQTLDDDNQRVLFSVWDATESEAGEHSSYCETFGGEGMGYSCRNDQFRWEPGVLYTLRAELRDGWVHGSISGGGRSLYLGRIKAPHHTHFGNGVTNFIEQFGVVSCNEAPVASAIFYPPRSGGVSARAGSGEVNERCARGFVEPYDEPFFGGGSYVRFGGDDEALAERDIDAIIDLGFSAMRPQVINYLPAAASRFNRSFVRIANNSALSGTVRIDAVDDTGEIVKLLTLDLGADEAVNITSMDVEFGNRAKGISGSTGAGDGSWRIDLTSFLDIAAESIVQTHDGLLAPLNCTDSAHEYQRVRVATFNPGSNYVQVSKLRLINSGNEDANVFIQGIDDSGLSPGPGVSLSIPAGVARTYSAWDLESGNAADLQGYLGYGQGQWRLIVDSDAAVRIINLVETWQHLTNMSCSPN